MGKLSKTCSIEGCRRKHAARGWCSNHYARWKEHGDPLKGRVSPGSLPGWLQENVNFGGNECLIWPFARNADGYGVLSFNGRRTIASRAMCELVHGEPEDTSMQAAHSCGNGHLGCVNPSHLRWATPIQNVADMKVHGTKLTGEKHGRSRLSDEDVRQIRASRGKMTQKELAVFYKTSVQYISLIQLGRVRVSGSRSYV